MRLIYITLISTLSIGVCLADVIVFKDGTRLEGDVKRSIGGWTITTADGKTIDVPAEKVKSIEVGKTNPNGKTAADQAMSSLLSLRRSTENVSDLKLIIDRFNRFIEQFKETPAAAEAQKDLAMWQERFERGLVKLGSRWVTPQERTEFADKALLVADQAREMVAHGRLHDADSILTQALDLDPLCAPALYLRGVIQYQQNQLPFARKSFEAVAALITDHSPTLNNIAVILWRQNAFMPSVAKYEQAMTAAPANKLVLDNVAEALEALQDNDRKNRVAQSAFRKFSEQDARLQQTMAAQGQYRWGSSWVDRATMEEFRKIEKEVNEKLAAAKTEAETAEKQVRTIDEQIDRIEESLRQIEANSVTRDANGKLIRYPYPPAYYDLKNEQTRLRADRTTQITKANAARAQIKTLQGELPKPKYTGLQQIVGAEGTPVMLMPGQTPTSPSPVGAETAGASSAPSKSSMPPSDPPAPSTSQPADSEPHIPAPSWPAAPATAPTTAPTTEPSAQPS